MYYTDRGYAHERLRNGIVQTINKAPIFVSSVSMAIDGELTVEGCLLKGLKFVVVPISMVDPVPPKLGWVNHGMKSVYISRMPIRQFKQSTGYEVLDFRSKKDAWSALDWPWLSLYNTINDIYPTFKDCLKSIECKEVEKVAFNREFAIDSNGSMFYAGGEVGGYNGRTLELGKEYTYLLPRLKGVV